VIVTDDRAKLVLTFFSGIHQYRRVLRPDVVGMFAGTVSSFRNRRQLVHPECEMLPGAPPNADLNPISPELAAEFATEMIPVYPASAKVPSWRIAKSVKTVLDTLEVGEDPLPARLRDSYELAGRPRRSAPCTGRSIRPTGSGPWPGSSGTRPSCCRPRWRSGGWPPRPCRPCAAADRRRHRG